MTTRFQLENARHWAMLLVLAGSQTAFGSALMPCLKAAASPGGNVLVVIQRLEGTSELSLQVFPKEDWINAKDKLDTPSSYWTDFLQWTVAIDQKEMESCPLPLITDDGEFLILINRDLLVTPEREALRIYRRRDHIGDPLREGPDRGVFIKAVSFKEILPTDRFEGNQMWTDASPQWFVGSRLEFSADNRHLNFDPGRPNGVVIDLVDGVARKKPH